MLQNGIEVGTFSHNGQSFSALGASVQGDCVTGYVKETSRGVSLHTWDGKTMLKCRSETIKDVWRTFHGDTASALLFRLTRGRWIVGYSLGNGMLFRGELFEGTEAQAYAMARQLCDHIAETDWADEEDYEAEQAEKHCPDCGDDMDKDCMGEPRCPSCDEPCPHCYDGGADDDTDSDCDLD